MSAEGATSQIGWWFEIKAISAQPTEVGVGLSWAELGNIDQIVQNCSKLVTNLHPFAPVVQLLISFY